MADYESSGPLDIDQVVPLLSTWYEANPFEAVPPPFAPDPIPPGPLLLHPPRSARGRPASPRSRTGPASPDAG